jgi:hypothetical protein
MKNSNISKTFALMVGTVLPAIMLAALPIPSLGFAALAQHNDGGSVSENIGYNDNVIIDPMLQSSTQLGLNLNVDPDVITDKEDCDKASDNLHQANEQSTGQEARGDHNLSDGGLLFGPKIQTSTQLGLNINVDPDVVLTEGCVPVDNTSQTNDQSTDQEVSTNTESGERDSNIISPTIQRSDAIAGNINVSPTIIVPLPIS